MCQLLRSLAISSGLLQRLTLLFKRDAGFPRVPVIIPEVDGVAAATVRIPLAAHVLGVHRHQVLPVAKAHEFVIGSHLDFVGGKCVGNVSRLHLDAQHPIGFFVDPHGRTAIFTQR